MKERAANDKDYLPTELEVLSNRFRGNLSSIVWDGKALQCEKTVEGKTMWTAKIAPSKERWQQFLAELDRIEIWEWNVEYINPNYADGHSWGVLLEYGDKKIHSKGRNQYPTQFEWYEKAVLELLDQKNSDL